MQPDRTNASIVLIGSFQPDAFLPDALGRAKVISETDAKSAKFRLLVPAQGFQAVLDWGQILVGTDRFEISTGEAPFVRICDFVMKALHDIDTQLKVGQFGINLECHYNLGSVSARDALGTKVAPPDAWGTWGRQILGGMKTATPTQHGGVMCLQMRQPFGEERISGWLDVSVGPSILISDQSGIYLKANHHHQPSAKVSIGEADKSKEMPANDNILEFLSVERFERSILEIQTIFNEVVPA